METKKASANRGRSRGIPTRGTPRTPPGDHLLDPEPAPASSRPPRDDLEDETYHLLVQTTLEQRLEALDHGLRSSGTAPEEAAVGSRPATDHTCSLCREDLRALGLPYRVVLSCGRGSSQD